MQLISKNILTAGYDKNEKLIDNKKYQRYVHLKTRLLHICIPFSKKFAEDVVNLSKRFQPEGIIIHSTISPGTTQKIQSLLSIPIIYSATRGVHKRMLNDLKRYTKFYAIEQNAPRKNWTITTYEQLMKKSG